MSLTYAIADLHGRYDLLDRALSSILLHSSGGTIVTLGDYVDRGPDSKLVIERLMSGLVGCSTWRLISLAGNHELMMLETIRKPLHPDWWIGNGGGATRPRRYDRD